MHQEWFWNGHGMLAMTQDTPKTRGIDRDPDHRPSSSGYELMDTKEGLRWFLVVRGLGFLVLDTEFDLGPNNKIGKLQNRGCGVLEKDLFDYSERF